MNTKRDRPISKYESVSFIYFNLIYLFCKKSGIFNSLGSTVGYGFIGWLDVNGLIVDAPDIPPKGLVVFPVVNGLAVIALP